MTDDRSQMSGVRFFPSPESRVPNPESRAPSPDFESEIENLLEVEVVDPIMGEKLVLNPNLVVLAPAILSDPGNESLSPLLKR
ncbi:MAG: hypothetical protein AB1422_04045 [bacterium]